MSRYRIEQEIRRYERAGAPLPDDLAGYFADWIASVPEPDTARAARTFERFVTDADFEHAPSDTISRWEEERDYE